jgi:hypothetical protein
MLGTEKMVLKFEFMCFHIYEAAVGRENVSSRAGKAWPKTRIAHPKEANTELGRV